MKRKFICLGAAVFLCVTVFLMIANGPDSSTGEPVESVEMTLGSECLLEVEPETTEVKETETQATEAEMTEAETTEVPATEETESDVTEAEEVSAPPDIKVTKRLVQINEYTKSGVQSTYLCYDDKTGLLNRVIIPDNEIETENGIVNLDYVYEYDSKNRLVKVTSGDIKKDPISAYSLELKYDQSGRVIKYKQFYPFLGECEVDCIYDKQGRLTQMTEKRYDLLHFEKYDYTYDESNSIMEVAGREFWPSCDDFKKSDINKDENYEEMYFNEYQYDDQNRVSVSLESYYERPVCKKFIYDYDPILIIDDGDEYDCWYDLGYFSGINAHLLYKMYGLYEGVYGPFSRTCSKNEQLVFDEDGYLIGAKEITYDWEFIWEIVEVDA